MAILKRPKTEDQIKKSGGIANLRKDYMAIANDYNKILDKKVLYCHGCDTFHGYDLFYTSPEYASGYFPFCKKCVKKMAMDYDSKTDEYKDNREKTKFVLQMMNLPFFSQMYDDAIFAANDPSRGGGRKPLAWSQVITNLRSLPQYQGMTWNDSVFTSDEDTVTIADNRKARKEIKKIFGSGFTEPDYLFLQDQYDDWRSRTQVDSKSQEIYVTQICLQLLDIDKDRKRGKDVTNKLKALDNLMNAANLQPKQNVSNAATDALTFGQMIERWEQHDPVPEPDEEFKDVDGIGRYITVWFLGHLCKVFGLKNAYSEAYDEEMAKLSVLKPEFKEDSDDDEYSNLFGDEE